MVEYVPIIDYPCERCANDPQAQWVANNTAPKKAILTLILILNHDLKRDINKQGFWIDYQEDEEDACPICNRPLMGELTLEASCLHRYHYDCLMHQIIVHDDRFCSDPDCGMRIY